MLFLKIPDAIKSINRQLLVLQDSCYYIFHNRRQIICNILTKLHHSYSLNLIIQIRANKM